MKRTIGTTSLLIGLGLALLLPSSMPHPASASGMHHAVFASLVTYSTGADAGGTFEVAWHVQAGVGAFVVDGELLAVGCAEILEGSGRSPAGHDIVFSASDRHGNRYRGWLLSFEDNAAPHYRPQGYARVDVNTAPGPNACGAPAFYSLGDAFYVGTVQVVGG